MSVKQRTICPGLKFTWQGMGVPILDVSLSEQLSAYGACSSVRAPVSTSKPVDVSVCYSLTRSLILIIVFLCVLEFIHRPPPHGCACVCVLLMCRSLCTSICICVCVCARTCISLGNPHSKCYCFFPFLLSLTLFSTIYFFVYLYLSTFLC